MQAIVARDEAEFRGKPRRWHSRRKQQLPRVKSDHEVGAEGDHDRKHPEVTSASAMRSDEKRDRIRQRDRHKGRRKGNPQGAEQDAEVVRRPTHDAVTRETVEIVERESPDKFTFLVLPENDFAKAAAG